MSSQALSPTKTGQFLENDPPKVGCAPTLSCSLSSGGSRPSPSAADTLNSCTKLVAASSRNASKKLAEKDDDESKCPKCAVPCCKRTGERLFQTTFFPCPLEPHPSSRLWAKAMGVRAILKNMYICEDHFQLEDDLENYLKFKYYPRGQQRFPRFKKGVVPWKFPKCFGNTPTVHNHRGPFSRTAFYKRQRARINKARRTLAAGGEPCHEGLSSPLKLGYNSELREQDNAGDHLHNEEAPKSSRKSPENRRSEEVQSEEIESTKQSIRKSEVKGENDCAGDKYFSMLNGDLSSLIAHVQPAICSWDVSEVRAESSSLLNPAGVRGEPGGVPDNKGSDSESNFSEYDVRTAGPKSVGNSLKSEKSSPNVFDALAKGRGLESASSRVSDEESDDEVYMTPSEDEVNGDQETSDSEFNVSSDESWKDHEFDRPTRRSTRNRPQKTHRRPDRFSPTITLRSRAKKRAAEQLDKSPEPSHSSPESFEKRPVEPQETQNSDSGVSSASCNADSHDIKTSRTSTADHENGGANENVDAVERQLQDKLPLKEKQQPEEILKKSPSKDNQSKNEMSQKPLLKENKSNALPRKPKNTYAQKLLMKNKRMDDVIKSVSLGLSYGEGDLLEVNQKTDESSSTKSLKSTAKGEESPLKGTNMDDNPKWRLRTKSPTKGTKLDVDMGETVAQVYCPESQTSYSYKNVVVDKKPGSRWRGRQQKFLVVRDGDQVLASSNSLPPQICGLISNMRNTLESFFANLVELKSEMRDHHADNTEIPADSCLAEPYVDRLLEEFKKFPDLMELEMAQFATKCEKFYDEEMRKSFKNSKKIRWCNCCQNAARFHCCFSAAYCSRLCQTKDWRQHTRNCGQSRMLLDDPDLKLSPSMNNRLKSLAYCKPTIGTSMSNLEELCQTFRPSANGKRLLASKNPPKVIKRPNVTGVVNSTPKAKIKRSYLTVNSFVPSSSEMGVSSKSTGIVPSLQQSTELTNPAVKEEPLDIDMEVEHGEPLSRPTLVRLGYPVVNNSPSKSNAANQQVHIAIASNMLAGLPSNLQPIVNTASNIAQLKTTSVNSIPRIAPIAVLPRNSGSTILLPKNTSPGTTNSPVTLRCKTVVLPTGETQYIPVDGQTWSFKPNAQLVVKHVNNNSAGTPVTVIKQATTSGSILITRPAKPTYSKFMPTSSAPTHTVNSTGFSPEIDTTASDISPRLPKLTPVMPKPDPAIVRTLDTSELDKILSTDHLKEAFDASYSYNILRP